MSALNFSGEVWLGCESLKVLVLLLASSRLVVHVLMTCCGGTPWRRGR